MEACAAAVPMIQRNYAGRMVGGDLVIDFDSEIGYWAECGEPSVAIHEYRCEHGHAVRRATCTVHAPRPGIVGCRECFDQGHECGMQVTELGK